MGNSKEKQVDGIALSSYILLIISIISIGLFYWCDLFSDSDSFICSLCMFEDQALCFHTNYTSSYRILNVFLIPGIISLTFGLFGLFVNKNKTKINRNPAKRVVIISVLLLLFGFNCYYLLPFIFFFGY